MNVPSGWLGLAYFIVVVIVILVLINLLVDAGSGSCV